MKRFIIIVLAAVIAFANPVSAEQKGIATLESFSGGVTIKSLGSWGVSPKQGMPLYQGDKILTADGTAKVLFNDGAKLEIRQNSIIRIAENPISEEKPNEKRRELRLLLGKVTYQSDKSKTQTTLISPTAVAALRGTIVDYGTDGKQTWINRVEGESENAGNIKEGQVPESSRLQAMGDRNYQACINSIQAWEKYENEKRVLEKEGVESYGKVSRTDRIIASSMSDDPNKRDRYDGFIGTLSEYSLASIMEDSEENFSLKDNPDNLVTNRALEALSIAAKAITSAQKSVERAKEIFREVDSLKDKGDSKGGAILIRSAVELNSAHEKSAAFMMLNTESYTIGLQNIGNRTNELIGILDETLSAAENNYEKTRIYLETAARSDEKNAAMYLKLADMTSKNVVADAAVTNLTVNTLEMIISDDAQNIKEASDELWRTVEAKDHFTGIVDNAEIAYRDSGTFDIDTARVEQILTNVESSSDLFNNFAEDMERRSMVLSPADVSLIILPDPSRVSVIVQQKKAEETTPPPPAEEQTPVIDDREPASPK